MKTWKQGIFGILAVIALTFALIACDNGNGKTDPVCTCNPKEHYLPCTCGGTDCNCIVIPRGYVTDADRPTTNFPIYQSVGVDNEQATTAVENINAGYNALGDSYKNDLEGANVEIWIIPSSGTNSQEKDNDGKVIMRIRDNLNSDQISARLELLIVPLVKGQ